MSSAIADLSHVGLMAGLPTDALAQVAERARVRRFGSGERIFNQGDPEVRAHVLISGAVRITQSGPEGGEVLLRFITPGEIFGAVALFTDRRYPGDATAAEESLEVSWTETELLQVIQTWPQVGINMIKVVGRRLLEAQERVRELSTQRAEQRIANTLLRLAKQGGAVTANGVCISTRLRRRDVADLSGTTLYTASRILTGWEKAGILQTLRSSVLLRRTAALELLANGEPLIRAVG